MTGLVHLFIPKDDMFTTCELVLLFYLSSHYQGEFSSRITHSKNSVWISVGVPHREWSN